MNILVVPLNCNSYYTRPDTTLERESKDYYCPDDITLLSLSITVNVKIIKSGKAIGRKFADRYFKDFGIGLLMYGESLIKEDNPLSFSMASSLDNTSVIPDTLFASSELNSFYCNLSVNDQEFNFSGNIGFHDYINAKLEEISRRVSLRIGDIVSFEISHRLKLERDAKLQLSANDQPLLSFKIC